jgi:hypothetical protein
MLGNLHRAVGVPTYAYALVGENLLDSRNGVSTSFSEDDRRSSARRVNTPQVSLPTDRRLVPLKQLLGGSSDSSKRRKRPVGEKLSGANVERMLHGGLIERVFAHKHYPGRGES